MAGAAAGTVGQTVAYPLDVVRRRMQVPRLLTPDHKIVLHLRSGCKSVSLPACWLHPLSLPSELS